MSAPRPVELVVKLGGGLLAHPAALDRVLAEVAAAARERALVVVPGGGPFADAVRAADRALGIHPSAAHWMAILAMDQHAQLLAARAPGAVLASSAEEARTAGAGGRLPILAPYRWVRAADPLPHGWEVTSDSIAAWVAAALGAPRLVLVKPPGAPAGPAAVDGYFARALGPGTVHAIVPADARARLASALRG